MSASPLESEPQGFGEQQPGTIDVEEHGDVSVVSLVGEHDLITAEAVRDQLAASASSGRGLVVSLMQTTFFDSSVIHALFNADNQLKEHDRQLVLHVATAPIVHRVLTISGLSDAMRCTGSLDQAIELAGQGSEGSEWSTG